MGRDKKTVQLREDVYELQKAYDDKDPDSKETQRKKLVMQKVLWSFHIIQQLDPKDPNSFFQIAGYHGMPFRGAGWGNPSWWGGYCNHGNVLFPTWHRAYLLRLENALRSVKGCEDVALPYWNETSSGTRHNGIPDIFLRQKVTIPSSIHEKSDSDLEIDNPLRSYTFQDGITDNLQPVPDADYSKPKGYETKRYPFSGLASSSDIAATNQHNMLMTILNGNDNNTDKLLNKNVRDWLNNSITLSSGQKYSTNTACKYEQCLKAPSYTVFSNATSAAQYNDDICNNTGGNYADSKTGSSNGPTSSAVVSLESAHNDMHLAVGGFSIPGMGDFDPIIGANGDMGENDTAAFDPIFYFHHCFIDKVFWDWQKTWDSTLNSRTQLTIVPEYPGTNSVDSQGPTPGVAGNTWLTMKSPLAPFTKNDEQDGDPLTSNDVVNIVSQLGYKYYDCDDKTYENGTSCKDETCGCRHGAQRASLANKESRSLFELPVGNSGTPEEKSMDVVRISGVNRATIKGSFVLVARATIDGQECVVGTESVLSRWGQSGCANCQSHLGVKAFVPLFGLDHKVLHTVRVGLHGHETSVDNLNSSSGIKGGWRLGKMGTPHGIQPTPAAPAL
ncbi:tyrosinase [Grosmannia clavigera kw1407]|uniref:tyrosinase n=1 Tax=Grosmannia clavigera (strain kw1407 / UAMH 11150) TaxID=655863 RepID=F0XQM3_GROCL|nr:tyrosinase [Grosmannia clavigera kw1407]EFX00015.1 tyrosinase [Grosmannia clavigera kw1407]